MNRYTAHGLHLEYIATENPIEINGGNSFGEEFLSLTSELPNSRKIILLDSRTNSHPENSCKTGPYLDIFLNREKEGVEIAKFCISERLIDNEKVRCTFPYSHLKDDKIIKRIFEEEDISNCPDLLYDVIKYPSKRWLQKMPMEKLYAYEKDINSLAKKPAQLVLLLDTIGLREPIENAVREGVIKSKTTYARISEIKKAYETSDNIQPPNPQELFNIVRDMSLPSYYKKVDRLDKSCRSYKIFLN